jgi:hypothetical protein
MVVGKTLSILKEKLGEDRMVFTLKILKNFSLNKYKQEGILIEFQQCRNLEHVPLGLLFITRLICVQCHKPHAQGRGENFQKR